MFSQQDQEQIQGQGATLDLINEQIQHFVNGFPFLKAIKAATIGDGIVRVSDEQILAYLHQYDDLTGDYTLMKFVPASGAATRMFKSLFAALDGKSDKATDEFFARLADFAFYEDLKAVMAAKGDNIATADRADRTPLPAYRRRP